MQKSIFTKSYIKIAAKYVFFVAAALVVLGLLLPNFYSNKKMEYIVLVFKQARFELVILAVFSLLVFYMDYILLFASNISHYPKMSEVLQKRCRTVAWSFFALFLVLFSYFAFKIGKVRYKHFRDIDKSHSYLYFDRIAFHLENKDFQKAMTLIDDVSALHEKDKYILSRLQRRIKSRLQYSEKRFPQSEPMRRFSDNSTVQHEKYRNLVLATMLNPSDYYAEQLQNYQNYIKEKIEERNSIEYPWLFASEALERELLKSNMTLSDFAIRMMEEQGEEAVQAYLYKNWYIYEVENILDWRDHWTLTGNVYLYEGDYY